MVGRGWILLYGQGSQRTDGVTTAAAQLVVVIVGYWQGLAEAAYFSGATAVVAEWAGLEVAVSAAVSSGETSDRRAMQRGYNKGLQQLAKIKNAVPAAARVCKVPHVGAPCAGTKTCAQLEQPHPSGGVPELPPAAADEDRSCRDRFSAHGSPWTASSACEDGREQRTQHGLWCFASTAIDVDQTVDPLGGEYRSRKIAEVLQPALGRACVGDRS